MPQQHVECRICDTEATFDDVDAVIESEWTEVTEFGVYSPQGIDRLGYCPGHST